jgi:hypothetical protein
MLDHIIDTSIFERRIKILDCVATEYEGRIPIQVPSVSYVTDSDIRRWWFNNETRINTSTWWKVPAGTVFCSSITPVSIIPNDDICKELRRQHDL